MALYHFSAQVISRSKGRSSVAAAAYRSAEKILDERTGIAHDYTKKNDVLESEILLTKDAPDWMGDRSKLWNGVEIKENRKDAQLAREINIALPRELNPEQNWDLLKTFVQTEFVDKGMVADVNFHRGHQGNEEQPHGHVMLTMREITIDGFGKKVRAWNDKALLQSWREHWSEHCNRELARHGFDIRIDHRTLEAQGINLEPQSKIGAKSAELEMARYAEHQALAKRNGERILKDPSIALIALTRQQSTFTHQDIARFVNRHTVDSEQFKAVYETVKAHPELVHLGKDDRQRDRFTTRDMLVLETKMIEQVTAKSQTAGHVVSASRMERAMDGKNLSVEQVEALNHLTQGRDIACVVGFAGTGKSYMLDAARQAWEAEGYHIHGMTLSGIAAQNLEASAGIKSYTVASRLWYWEHDRERLTSRDIVVVDEAGMLGSRQMARIMEEVDRAGAKVVLVGDPEQLQAIEAGAAYRAIAQRVGFVEMTDIRRQNIEWQQQATKDLASERTSEALWAYEQHDNVHTFNTTDAAIEEMVDKWDAVRRESPDKSQIMLAYTRADVQTLNEQARELRRDNQELGADHKIETARGERSFAEGDRIYFLRNENLDMKVKNGTLGTIEKINEDKLIVSLDRGDNEKSRLVEFSLKDYNDIDHGYAATVYKAQGVTVDRTYVLASKYFDRHSTYVAMSRHREGADLYVSREDFPSFGSLNKNLGRERSKDVSLDYALTRGLDSVSPAMEKEHKRTPEIDLEKMMEKQRTIRAQKQMDSLADFKNQYRAQHPERSEELTLAVLPKWEREVVKSIKAHQNLSKELEKASTREGRYAIERKLDKQLDILSKDSKSIDIISRHDKNLASKVHQRAQEKSRARTVSRGFDIGW